jgi:Tol biopolymer transport system component
MRVSAHVNRVVAALALAGLAALALGGAPAQAAYHGKNGRIAYAGGGIWTMNPDGSDKTKVTFPPANRSHSQPAWSPDGRRIA